MQRSASFRFDCLWTGCFYLGLAITGGLAFLLVRPQLFIVDDPAGTLANLTSRPDLARAGIALELATAALQALAAVWFARLFRDTDPFASAALALFGMVNAFVMLASATFLGAALDAALGPTGAEPTVSHLLMLVSGRFWQAGNIFFGLWLVPMGWLVWQARFGHRSLGWILIVGGVGYALNPLVSVLAPAAGSWVGLLAILASIGEFWMIGLLLWRGLRQPERRVDTG